MKISVQQSAISPDRAEWYGLGDFRELEVWESFHRAMFVIYKLATVLIVKLKADR